MDDLPSAPVRLAIVMRPAVGGMRSHLETFLTLLNRKRFAPTLIAGQDFATFAERLKVPHIPLEIAGKTSPIADLRCIGELETILRKSFDIVHGHGVRGMCIGAFAAKRARLPFVTTLHNLLGEVSLPQSMVLAQALHRTQRLIAVSQAVIASFEANALPLPPHHVVPNGVVTTRSANPDSIQGVRNWFHVPESAPIVLGIGRLEKEKGFDQLLLAFDILRSQVPNAHLLIVGEGSQLEVLRGLAQSDLQVHFAGYSADPTAYYHVADVVAVPSRSEGQGMVALEAMAAGRPVAAFRVGGLVDTVKEGVTGLLVPPSDIEEMGRTLALLLNSPDLRRSMGEAGRARVVSRFSASQMVETIENIYTEILTEANNTRR